MPEPGNTHCKLTAENASCDGVSNPNPPTTTHPASPIETNVFQESRAFERSQYLWARNGFSLDMALISTLWPAGWAPTAERIQAVTSVAVSRGTTSPFSTARLDSIYRPLRRYRGNQASTKAIPKVQHESHVVYPRPQP